MELFAARSPQVKIVLAEMPMVQQSPIDEQIREYILQEERIGETRRQRVRIDEGVRQERRKWERRLGYFILAGVAVVVFAFNEYFPDKTTLELSRGMSALCQKRTFAAGPGDFAILRLDWRRPGSTSSARSRRP